MNFREKVEPFILSEDKVVQHFALRELNDSYLGTPESFLKALQALDRLEALKLKNEILPYTESFPFSDEVMVELIERLKKRDANYIWYCIALDHCPPTLLQKYKEEFKDCLDEKALAVIDNATSLLSLDTEQLFLEYGEISNVLEEDGYNAAVYKYGQRIFQELIRRHEYDDTDEIRNGITPYLDDEFFNFDGIYNVFLAGECKADSLTSLLVPLLLRTNEDLLAEEVTDALVKVGTEKVVREVGKTAMKGDAAYAGVDILRRIKIPASEEILLEHLETTEDLTIKTLIAEALCAQLSTKAIPKVASMIETGYDKQLLELEEDLYVCCVITGFDHPDLPKWKQTINDMELKSKKVEKDMVKHQAKTMKIGRNDPCPCGSGKKYKKCCGA